MKIIRRLLLLFCILGLISCGTIGGKSQTAADAKTTWRSRQFNWASYIDYSSPEKYLSPGMLSDLSQEKFEMVQSYFEKRVKPKTKVDIINGIYKYMKDGNNFSSYAAGGALIAKRTVGQIFEEKTLSGCHDWGLVLCTLLRKFNIPAVYVDSALVGWAQNYIDGIGGSFEGHIFVEAFVDGRWILLNSTNALAIKDYDPLNPLLGFCEKGTNYFVMFKGLDPWDYGIYSNEDVQNAMKKGARQIITDSKKAPKPGNVSRI